MPRGGNSMRAIRVASSVRRGDANDINANEQKDLSFNSVSFFLIKIEII